MGANVRGANVQGANVRFFKDESRQMGSTPSASLLCDHFTVFVPLCHSMSLSLSLDPFHTIFSILPAYRCSPRGAPTFVGGVFVTLTRQHIPPLSDASQSERGTGIGCMVRCCPVSVSLYRPIPSVIIGQRVTNVRTCLSRLNHCPSLPLSTMSGSDSGFIES